MTIFTSPISPLQIKDETLPQKIFDACQKYATRDPNSVAFINADDLSSKVLYSEIEPNCRRVAAFLQKLGLKENDAVCQILVNSMEYIYNVLGCHLCGAALSGMSPNFTEYEIKKYVVDMNAKFVITSPEMVEVVLKAVKDLSSQPKVICVTNSDTPLPEGVINHSEYTKCSPEDYQTVQLNPDAVALLPFSSGTTGPPKAVMQIQKSLCTGIDMTILMLNTQFAQAAFGKEVDDWYGEYIHCLLPFFHTYGWAVVCANMMLGFTGIIFKKLDVPKWLSVISQFKMKVIFGVPPLVLLLAKDPRAKAADFSSVRVLGTGAAPTGSELLEQFKKRFPNIWICQGFGMTETMSVILMPYWKLSSPHSCGVLIPNTEMKIVDENNNELEVGQRGQLCFRGPTVMRGYLNRPEDTKQTLRNGWLYSGDIGYVHSNGAIFVVDRLKEMIKVNGFQVAPAELEDLLLKHPLIVDAAVVGIPNPKFGEVPVAFVVRKDPSLSETNVQDFVKANLSHYKHLVGGVHFVESIPKLPSGKIRRRVLKEKLLSQPSKCTIM